MSKLVFCVEASASAGMGHLMRCLALAQAAQTRGLDSVWLVPEPVLPVCRQRHDWVGRAEQAASTEAGLAAQVEAICQQEHVLATVLDGYHFSADLAQQLQRLEPPLLVLDDIQGATIDSADIIVNPAGESLHRDYSRRNSTATLCLGAPYRLLRSEFAVTLPLELSQRRSLTVSLGGSDPKHYTLPLLDALAATLPDVPLRVVTGPGFAHRDALDDFISDSPAIIQHVHNCQDMADVWVNARLAVAAAGGTQFELAACHTPAVLLVVADNQLVATEQASEQGWCETWDARESLDAPALSEKIKALWDDAQTLESMHQGAANYAFTEGADNVLDMLAEHLQNLQQATGE
ncbi:UDP-2,4-diacetamido-2,4,6-trideoxy-beta-L-altropyranose hydrolase [Alteromonas gilva]|uniref:UDP-2,4-diacetamido-2,4, 6-trideoxy-beta-L-altropyranose hydrolase n=1 Tax=Alteromonas gilva TaxID=2987522 RepID=A0ABT5L0B6_9ALTE|nr:UDP-2,4-diacetamido-2,4,6-trideoxy-beta-L-altropyranose hydrolase [Alteromonas gilva]MDC8830460.1 UDP-2,4-diacetamido-2,4,6-trideoxy-beta-L-altropyranose hydrolase [Alteromonas gilva]